MAKIKRWFGQWDYPRKRDRCWAEWLQGKKIKQYSFLICGLWSSRYPWPIRLLLQTIRTLPSKPRFHHPPITSHLVEYSSSDLFRAQLPLVRIVLLLLDVVMRLLRKRISPRVQIPPLLQRTTTTTATAMAAATRSKRRPQWKIRCLLRRREARRKLPRRIARAIIIITIPTRRITRVAKMAGKRRWEKKRRRRRRRTLLDLHSF